MPRRLSSSCRQFRRQHAEFVDGYLSDEAQRAARVHLDECPVCARHDVQIRRSLMALQALPMIEPSAGFHDRLYERIAREELHYSPVPTRPVRWGMATAIVAASVALLFAASSRSRQSEASRPAPVLALVPARPAPQRPAPARTARIPAANASAMTAATAPRSRARFEALPGPGAARSGTLLQQGSAIRLQTVNYIGQ
ncbi:MAG: zf-HC2 domain-containing protein [Gemmatimonadaceae bacterium]